MKNNENFNLTKRLLYLQMFSLKLKHQIRITIQIDLKKNSICSSINCIPAFSSIVYASIVQVSKPTYTITFQTYQSIRRSLFQTYRPISLESYQVCRNRINIKILDLLLLKNRINIKFKICIKMGLYGQKINQEDRRRLNRKENLVMISRHHNSSTFQSRDYSFIVQLFFLQFFIILKSLYLYYLNIFTNSSFQKKNRKNESCYSCAKKIKKSKKKSLKSPCKDNICL